MPKRILSGIVVSAKTQNTVTVEVVRNVLHPAYKKFYKSTKKYAAHDPNSEFKQGDKVNIIESKPISKTKKWLAVKVQGEVS